MKKIIITGFIFTALLTSCKKDFFNLNESPNSPVVVPAKSLLASAQYRTAASLVSPNLSLPATWMGYFGFSPSFAIPTDNRNYVITNTTGAGYFTTLYQTAYDYNKLSNFAKAEGSNFLEGVGIIMKAFMMQNAVDIYNKVPYSEAFLENANITPKYDDGKIVYEALYTSIGDAIVKLKLARTLGEVLPTKTQDLMYGGSSNQIDLWIKFANTLRLRFLIRQSLKADRASYISAKLATDFPAGLASFIQENEGAAINPGYTNAENQQNPFWANYGLTVAGTDANPSIVAGQYALNFYTSQNDFRAFYMYKPIGNGSFFGSAFNGNEMGQQGATSPGYSKTLNAGAATSTNHPEPYRFVTDKQPIITDFQSLFLQAEAVQRGWFGGSASSIYSKALFQSFVHCFGADASAKLALLTPTANNDWNLAADKIQLIITQKWAALNTINYLEPWTEYRRTGFPMVPLSSSPTRGSNVIPVRFLYPQAELNVNGGNVPALSATAAFTDKIWWAN